MSRALNILLAVGAGLALLALITALGAARLPGHQQGYTPEQPIEFSHLLHAGELKMDCLYCHHGAESSRHAGLPAASTCMNCHQFVTAPIAEIRAEDQRALVAERPAEPVVSTELAKLYDALAIDPLTGLPLPSRDPHTIRWEKIHVLPDFVYFDHRAHVTVGIDCAACHGPVDSMLRVRQDQTLTMGFCIDCHRRSSSEGVAGLDVNASTDCSTCHY